MQHTESLQRWSVIVYNAAALTVRGSWLFCTNACYQALFIVRIRQQVLSVCASLDNTAVAAGSSAIGDSGNQQSNVSTIPVSPAYSDCTYYYLLNCSQNNEKSFEQTRTVYGKLPVHVGILWLLSLIDRVVFSFRRAFEVSFVFPQFSSSHLIIVYFHMRHGLPPNDLIAYPTPIVYIVQNKMLNAGLLSYVPSSIILLCKIRP